MCAVGGSDVDGLPAAAAEGPQGGGEVLVSGEAHVLEEPATALLDGGGLGHPNVIVKAAVFSSLVMALVVLTVFGKELLRRKRDAGSRRAGNGGREGDADAIVVVVHGVGG